MSNKELKPQFLQDKVVKHFLGASASYAERRGTVHPEDPEIIELIRQSLSAHHRVLEVGGGSGYLLDLISRLSSEPQTYNCELAYQAYKNQIGESVNLVGGSALRLPFAVSSFDIVVAKNLLHHLIGSSRQESALLAKHAALEMSRVVRNRGLIVILEQYHRSKIASTIIFFSTLLFSFAGIQIKALEIRPDVIVSFLTPDEIRWIFDRADFQGDRVILDRTEAVAPSGYYRLFPYLNRFGRMLFAKIVSK